MHHSAIENIFRELLEKKRQKKEKLDYYSLFEVSVSVLHVPCVGCVTYNSSQNYACSFFLDDCVASCDKLCI